MINTGELQKEVGLAMVDKLKASEMDEAFEWIKKGRSAKGRLAKLEAFIEEKNAPAKEELADETLNEALKFSNRLFKAANLYSDHGIDGVKVAEARKSNLDALEAEIKMVRASLKSLEEGVRAFKARVKGKEVE